MSIQLVMPEITSVNLTPNPVEMNSTVYVQVYVSEKTVTLDEEKIYSGELYSGED